jgi:hypothetical protein
MDVWSQFMTSRLFGRMDYFCIALKRSLWWPFAHRARVKPCPCASPVSSSYPVGFMNSMGNSFSGPSGESVHHRVRYITLVKSGPNEPMRFFAESLLKKHNRRVAFLEPGGRNSHTVGGYISLLRDFFQFSRDALGFGTIPCPAVGIRWRV